MSLNRLTARAGVVRRLLGYLWQERLWWMAPMVIILLVFGAVILFTQSSAVAPFIYTLF